MLYGHAMRPSPRTQLLRTCVKPLFSLGPRSGLQMFTFDPSANVPQDATLDASFGRVQYLQSDLAFRYESRCGPWKLNHHSMSLREIDREDVAVLSPQGDCSASQAPR